MTIPQHIQKLVHHFKGSRQLTDTHQKAGSHISHSHGIWLKAQLRVNAIGKILTAVMSIAAGSGSYPNHSQILGGLIANNTSSADTILEVLLLSEHSRQIFHTLSRSIHNLMDMLNKLWSNILTNSSRYNNPPEESIASHSFTKPHQLFLQPAAQTDSRIEAYTCWHIAQITYMIGNALQLGKQGADNLCPARYSNSCCLLHSLTKTPGIGHTAGATNALHNMEGFLWRFTLYSLFNTSMGKEQLGIQLQHGLASLTKTEVTRLNNTGMNRAYRHLKQSLALGSTDFEFALPPYLGINGH